MQKLLISMIVSLPMICIGGPKEEFFAAVEKQCGVSGADAKALATPGRSGTVVQYKLCLRSAIRVSGDCTIKCKKKGSNIGR